MKLFMVAMTFETKEGVLMAVNGLVRETEEEAIGTSMKDAADKHGIIGNISYRCVEVGDQLIIDYIKERPDLVVGIGKARLKGEKV